MSTTTKWINILSILLALLSMGELMFTATLLFLISIILSKTVGYVSTVCGLISSLVCLPTAFKIRSIYSALEIRVHHFDMQTYHRYMLYISLIVQTSCVVACCISLANRKAAELAISKSMERYQHRYSDKKFIDIVQMLFQCCGVNSYHDWAQQSWPGSFKREIIGDDNEDYFETLAKNASFMNKDTPFVATESPMMATVTTLKTTHSNISATVPTFTNFTAPMTTKPPPRSLFAVPYSCCKIEANKPCKHYDILGSGTETVNTFGCAEELECFLYSVLFSELVVFALIIAVIGIILKMIHVEESEICCEDYDDYPEEDKCDCGGNNSVDPDWEKFTNSLPPLNQLPIIEDEVVLEEEDSKEEEIVCLEECSHCGIELQEKSKISSDTAEELKRAELIPTSQEQLVIEPRECPAQKCLRKDKTAKFVSIRDSKNLTNQSFNIVTSKSSIIISTATDSSTPECSGSCSNSSEELIQKKDIQTLYMSSTAKKLKLKKKKFY